MVSVAGMEGRPSARNTLTLINSITRLKYSSSIVNSSYLKSMTFLVSRPSTTVVTFSSPW